MKILYITNQPSPYQLHFQKEFNNIEDSRLDFMFYHKVKNRPKNWQSYPEESEFMYSHEFLKLIPRLSSYDAILTLGVARKLSLLLLLLKSFKVIRNRIFIVTETMRDEKKGKFRNSIVLKGLLNLYQIFGFRFLATNYHSQFQLELLEVKPITIQVFHYPIGIYDLPLLRKEIEIKNNVRLLFCSRMIEQYDPIEAIRQYVEWQRIYPNVSLTMVKYGPLFDYVNDFVKKEGVDVHFADPVAFEDLAEFYSNYDFLLLPARFGNGNAVVMEAGICGVVPVIRDSTPGAREQIIQGLTGFRYKTEKEFIKTLNLAMTLTSSERVQVQKNMITAFGHRTPRGRAYRLYEIVADNI